MRPHDEIVRELLSQWLDKAARDLKLTRHLVSAGEYNEAVCFHAQQAAEKYIKAFLVHHQVEFPKTHDIEELLDLVETRDQNLAQSLRHTAVLSAYGVEIRYPGDLPEITDAEAEKAVALAGRVGDSILEALKK